MWSCSKLNNLSQDVGLIIDTSNVDACFNNIITDTIIVNGQLEASGNIVLKGNISNGNVENISASYKHNFWFSSTLLLKTL
jgi:hypothetical protein